MKHLFMMAFILSLFLVMINGCQLFESTPEEWVPVLEGTDFGYLRDIVSQAVSDAEEARQNFRNKNYQKAGEKIEQSRRTLLKLQRYYIPMTEVRQLVYDADRLFYLRKTSDALDKLRQARVLLVEIRTTATSGFAESIDEAIGMLDELILAIEDSSQTAGERFRELGHRINLMVLKGELILSEEDFE